MSKAEMPVQATRELLDAKLGDRQRIDRDDLEREARTARLGEDVEVAIRTLQPGDYTRAQLEAELLPEVEDRVRSRLAGLGGGPSEPAGKKGTKQGKQQGRR